MSNILYRGDAPAVAQVNTVTPDTVTIGNIFTLTCNGKTISYTAAAATVADVTAGLVALLNSTTIAEFQEVTAVDLSTALTLTCKTPGMPFTITSSAATGSGSAGCHLVTAATIANTGPADVSILSNYSTGALPTGSDTLIVDGAVNLLYGLPALAAAGPTIIFNPDFTGDVGLPRWNANGYYEYRPLYLQCVSTSVTNRSQSGRIKLDFGGTNSVTINQLAAGNPNGEAYAVTLKNTGTGCTLNIQEGVVGLAPNQLDTFKFATLNIGSVSNPASDVTVFCGSGVTPDSGATINQNGGQVTLQTSVANWNMPSAAGVGHLWALAGISTLLDIEGSGTVFWEAASTINNFHLGPKATLDTGNPLNPVSKTATNGTVEAGSTINDPAGLITFMNPIAMGHGCGLEDLNLAFGKNRHFQVS